ncbi:unnamed protein product [marine sediment metagenome]|uniref:Uncharacterized protein n=1 Tax=marine sediment metagenome TaxID=412755 RepID=X0Z9B1_9ZZZZ
MIGELFNASTILAWVIFGSIGMIYVGYGKWKDLWQPKALGFSLMFYPYFVSGEYWLWGTGGLLTLAIFFARD